MSWRVSISPEPGYLIGEVLACIRVWRLLTGPQRAALLTATEGEPATGHPLTLRALRDHNLLDQHNRPTEVGELVAKWNKPKEAQAQ
jgi:hypothetical protein